MTRIDDADGVPHAQRVCFRLRVRPELMDEYRARHAEVWPEMRAAIARAGRRNYSLFLAADGTLIGYYETDDDADAQRMLSESPVAARWEAEMARFFLAASGRPDQAGERLPEVFHLTGTRSDDGGTRP
ncbi:L-rhamnose mutarotase [Microbacterium flavum]|uniref:L-rhamnose mutarotase n=1 Tax=Microbacterium flavum TaxID=415216 RepID=A0ABS5XQE6_9MICO|nr:L-rhamnose mutarotase [Microbacterium flavum]MBT8796748.1 L-rhamnose mutarotase [Microbacterium flavum]